jgi:hypothetical protein
MMNKRVVDITCIEDLEREERKVIRRIKKQEEELLVRIKQLPEEVVATGISKIVSGILEGKAFKSIINGVKRVGNGIISKLFDDEK